MEDKIAAVVQIARRELDAGNMRGTPLAIVKSVAYALIIPLTEDDLTDAAWQLAGQS